MKDVKVIKEAGINNISRKFLKESAGMLAISLTQICNLSLKLSYFTNSCKLEFWKPLYKKGSKTDPKNPCQISLQPIASQIIEKIIQDETMEYLTESKILHRYQSGFSKNHSTDTSILYLTDKTFAR